MDIFKNHIKNYIFAVDISYIPQYLILGIQDGIKAYVENLAGNLLYIIIQWIASFVP